MPELPDLEVFAANLHRKFKNNVVTGVEVTVPRKLNVPADELRQALEGHRLQKVIRDGKTLQLHFEGGTILGLHLMLHGQIEPLTVPEPKFQILSIRFDSGEGFALTDFQKAAVPTLNPPVAEVPDALAIDIEYLRKNLNKSTQIKALLLNQKVIRGIGNTYADEILWEAGISPFSVARAIPDDKVTDLLAAIRKVLREEIDNIAGVLPAEFNGEVTSFLKIHHPKLTHSPAGAEIMVDKTGGRKTYYTAEQKLYH